MSCYQCFYVTCLASTEPDHDIPLTEFTDYFSRISSDNVGASNLEAESFNLCYYLPRLSSETFKVLFMPIKIICTPPSYTDW